MSQKQCAELFYLVLVWFKINDKSMKTLGFLNNAHLLDLSSPDVWSRGVFRTLSDI